MDEEGSRQRDPERTRQAILDAAEALFARKGYDATSLREVGEAAGVSRGTPSYFFGSKERLYEAVLHRTFEEARAMVAGLERQAAQEGSDPESVLAAGVAAYADFLGAHPAFVELVEWESRRGGQLLGTIPPHVAGIQGAIELLRSSLARGGFRPVDPVQLLLSVMGMCWFPIAQAGALREALGADPRDPAFREARKRHMIDLILNGVRAR